MIEQDWIWGLVGGLMIGTAAALYLLANGRIMGASGVLGELIDGSGRASAVERIIFVAGLVVVPLFDNAATHVSTNPAVVIVAGLLVGVGTRLANGCTSGHGVCGMSRLSLRSIVATVLYLIAGGLTMVLLRHFLEVI